MLEIAYKHGIGLAFDRYMFVRPKWVALESIPLWVGLGYRTEAEEVPSFIEMRSIPRQLVPRWEFINQGSMLQYRYPIVFPEASVGLTVNGMMLYPTQDSEELIGFVALDNGTKIIPAGGVLKLDSLSISVSVPLCVLLLGYTAATPLPDDASEGSRKVIAPPTEPELLVNRLL